MTGGTADELDAAVGRVYERVVAQVPPGGEKRHWRRYIFLWLDHALFEEIETKVLTILTCNLDYSRKNKILGLSSDTTGLPSSHSPSKPQAVHSCKTLKHVCEI